MEHRGALDLDGVGPDVIADHPFIHMVWQPIVHLMTDVVMGHETLARFDGACPDVVFDDAAERGLSERLDAFCVAQAVRQVPRDGLIFINVTAATIRSGHFPTIPPALASRIVWELPETGGWDPTMIPAGGSLALDDVGAGYSELVRVSHVSWRFLKLDRSIVTDVGLQMRYRRFIRDMVARAADRGGFVIAEGIERVADAQVLRELGVTYGQGYLWGDPQREPFSLRPPPA